MLGSKAKAFGIGLTLLIAGLNIVLDAFNKKQEEDRMREISNEVFDERSTKAQEVEFTEIENETEKTA